MDIKLYLESGAPHISLLKYLFLSSPPSVVLDIGSCEGEDSIRYRELFPASKIIAFEPNPENIKKLEGNLMRFGVCDIDVIPIALSDVDGNAELHISSGHPTEIPNTTEWDYGNKSSSLLKPSALMARFHDWLKFETTVTVRTQKLDSVLAELGIGSVDFVHMDVQGAEMMVLRGSIRTLPYISCLWLEVGTHEIYKDQPPAAETQSFLESYGFIRIMECLNEGSGDHFYVNPSRLKCVKVSDKVAG